MRLSVTLRSTALALLVTVVGCGGSSSTLPSDGVDDASSGANADDAAMGEDGTSTRGGGSDGSVASGSDGAPGLDAAADGSIPGDGGSGDAASGANADASVDVDASTVDAATSNDSPVANDSQAPSDATADDATIDAAADDDGPSTDATTGPDAGGAEAGVADGGGADGAPDAADGASVDAAPSCTVTLRGAQTAATSTSVSSIVLGVPPGTAANDLLIAYIFAGVTTATAQPALTAPSGWTLLDRTDFKTTGALAIYVRQATDTEPASYTWTSSQPTLHVSWMLGYYGVDPAQPIDTEATTVAPLGGTAFTSPALPTRGLDELVVASFVGHATTSGALLFSAPTGTTQLVDFDNAQSRGAASFAFLRPTAGTAPGVTSDSNEALDFAFAEGISLRPCP